jgi:carbonic anhydrase/acetyltransferase-like protein (isoleucine patch superfamily)
MILPFQDKFPAIAEDAFIFESADIIGDVGISESCSIWSNASVRADVSRVRIGRGSNVQDNAVIHVDSDFPSYIGEYVTIGHSAVVHGCTIEDLCIIGMGAIVLNGAKIGKNSIVGAGALVTQGKEFPPNSLIVGSPARVVRELTDRDIQHIKENAEEYIRLAGVYRSAQR